MINYLRLINFKPFENQFLKFRPLTLLSGLNSSGKSSVLQSLLLLRQSYQQSLLPNIGLALNGELVCIGTAQDAIFEGASKEEIGFDITWENDTEGIWRFNYDREVDVLNLASSSIPQKVYQSSLFSNNFHYLQAESETRLQQFEKQLTFRCPDDVKRVFSLHVRMTPGAWRLHFSPESGPGKIIIGYIGLKIQ